MKRIGCLALVLLLSACDRPDLTAPFDSFHATAVPAGATARIYSGNAQQAPAGWELERPIVVLVRDVAGAPLAGVSVAWAVTSGGGSVRSATSLTDLNGRARIIWTMGPAGAQRVAATVTGLPSVVFRASVACAPTTLRFEQAAFSEIAAGSCGMGDLYDYLPFTGPVLGSVNFFGSHIIQVPAKAIVEVHATRGTLGSSPYHFAYDAVTGTLIRKEFIDPLILRNHASTRRSFRVLITTTNSSVGTYSIIARNLRPIACQPPMALPLETLLDRTLVASLCTTRYRYDREPFAGPDATGLHFYDRYDLTIPANTIVRITVQRGTLPSAHITAFDEGTGAFVASEFIDPLVLSNTLGTQRQYTILVYANQEGGRGTYTIKAEQL